MSSSSSNKESSQSRALFALPEKQEPSCRHLKNNFVLFKTSTNRNASSENVIASFVQDGAMVLWE